MDYEALMLSRDAYQAYEENQRFINDLEIAKTYLNKADIDWLLGEIENISDRNYFDSSLFGDVSMEFGVYHYSYFMMFNIEIPTNNNYFKQTEEGDLISPTLEDVSFILEEMLSLLDKDLKYYKRSIIKLSENSTGVEGLKLVDKWKLEGQEYLIFLNDMYLAVEPFDGTEEEYEDLKGLTEV